MQDPTLVLRDIHRAIAPSWWPPAPGWWMLAAVVLAVLLVYATWRRHQRNKQRRIAGLFDSAIEAANGVPAQVAAVSELLRRAARRRSPHADKLQGEEWLSFLDADDKRRSFSQGAGRLLLEGGFRPDVDPHQAAALRSVARERFIGWMAR